VGQDEGAGTGDAGPEFELCYLDADGAERRELPTAWPGLRPETFMLARESRADFSRRLRCRAGASRAMCWLGARSRGRAGRSHRAGLGPGRNSPAATIRADEPGGLLCMIAG
jgi:hypothetical protein